MLRLPTVNSSNSRAANGNWNEPLIHRQLGGPHLVASELEAEDSAGAEARARGDDQVRQTQLVRIELEDLRIAIPNGIETDTRELDTRLPEGPVGEPR